MHEDLRAFLCAEVTGRGIPSQLLNKVGNSWGITFMTLSHGHRDSRYRAHAEAIDNSDVTDIISKGKSLANVPELCYVTLCVNFLTSYFLGP
jgi:hypothetical protein